jgi:hypothetical protein
VRVGVNVRVKVGVRVRVGLGLAAREESTNKGWEREFWRENKAKKEKGST